MTAKVFIFIPGYYGSTLIEKNKNRLIWGDPKELFFKRATLAMPVPGVPIPGAMELHPHSVIPNMQILGGLLKEEAYDKTIDFIKTQNPLEIFQVAWDWRREPLHGVIKLHEEVLKAKEKHPKAELYLVSHSYGSLVASYYLRYGVQDYFEAKENWFGLNQFKKVVLSACPFRGLMAIFRNMHKGIKFGLNAKMQDALAFSSFESSYYLMPSEGNDIVKDFEGKDINLDIYNPAKWRQNGWGLYHEKFNINNSDEISHYVSRNLERSKKFHALINDELSQFPINHANKILYLTGLGQKTLHKGVWLNNLKKQNVFLYYPKDFKRWKYKKINYHDLFGNGDATVPAFSLIIPKPFREIGAELHNDQLGHLDILQSDPSQKKINTYLNS